MSERVTVIGGGLAGCEAAWQLASRGVPVDLYEMRPVRGTEAHQTDRLGELVCSNSFRNASLETRWPVWSVSWKSGARPKSKSELRTRAATESADAY